MEKDDQNDTVKQAAVGNDKDAKAQILGALQQAGQRWLTDDEFNEQFDRAKEIAQDRDDDETLMSFWLYGISSDADDKKKACMPVMFADWPGGDDMDKDKIMAGIGAKFAEQFPDYMLTTVVQTSEAWMVERPKDAPEEDRHLAPSQSPNRVEIIMVHALSMDQRQSFWHAKILKDEDGKFTGLEQILESRHVTGKDSEWDGMLNNLSRSIFRGNYLAKGAKLQEEGII
jgi:hypothetical protein